jgi:HrpA-like RNA helicase
VDEVHERSLESDFLLMCLRDLMQRRGPNDPTCPKIILMSATLVGSSR